MKYYAGCYESPLGSLLMTSDGEALTGLSFVDEPSALQVTQALPVFADACRWLDLYFSGKVPDFTPQLSLQGSDFRRAVWEILLTIPYGQTISYGEIADMIARGRQLGKMSAQAVGGAVGHNPVDIIVPCHRVVGKDGSLTGYGGGLWRKEWLLKLENIT
ncbi:methylated-DNA--[protein]-cysteine S-methyltransferase [Selenomonas sp. KH1T6]|uniref:methylated-DNA--[protein]-cysteine S-methyltransferase n=1 Tax=Selenomonas sp. KH1T6 TaxID=3158784 RepID=UPI0008A7F6C8|nr:methylated-DNA-[protein]-cysteine S-methyltransferase [Selenomonas ruminantium]